MNWIFELLATTPVITLVIGTVLLLLAGFFAVYFLARALVLFVRLSEIAARLQGLCVKKTRKRHAVREMEVDPSEPLCRRRLQTAMSCFGQKPRW